MLWRTAQMTQEEGWQGRGASHIVKEFDDRLDSVPCSFLAAMLGGLPSLVLVPADRRHGACLDTGAFLDTAFLYVLHSLSRRIERPLFLLWKQKADPISKWFH